VVGVLEGNGGDLRTGLPWQSVHDGERLAHEPLRLNVVVEAPVAAINDVLRRHPQVRALADNGWLHLWAMDDAGALSHRYAGDLAWDPSPQPERRGRHGDTQRGPRGETSRAGLAWLRRYRRGDAEGLVLRRAPGERNQSRDTGVPLHHGLPPGQKDRTWAGARPWRATTLRSRATL
jgi:hypothetical protein